MTELTARSLSAFVLGLVGIFLVVVVGAGLTTGGFGDATGNSGGAAAPLGGGVQAQANAGGDIAAQGKQLFGQFNCGACHSLNGQMGVGPTMKGLAGSQRAFIDGSMAVADNAYLKESIQQPNAKIVQGYAANIMSGGIASYQSELNKDDVVNALIAYIKTVK